LAGVVEFVSPTKPYLF